MHHAASRSAKQRPLPSPPPPPPSARKPKAAAAANAAFGDSNRKPADADDDVVSDDDGESDGESDGGTDESGGGNGNRLSPRDLVALVELLAFADFALLFHLKDSALSALHGAITPDNACLCLVAADIHKVRR